MVFISLDELLPNAREYGSFIGDLWFNRGYDGYGAQFVAVYLKCIFKKAFY